MYVLFRQVWEKINTPSTRWLIPQSRHSYCVVTVTSKNWWMLVKTLKLKHGVTPNPHYLISFDWISCRHFGSSFLTLSHWHVGVHLSSSLLRHTAAVQTEGRHADVLLGRHAQYKASSCHEHHSMFQFPINTVQQWTRLLLCHFV